MRLKKIITAFKNHLERKRMHSNSDFVSELDFWRQIKRTDKVNQMDNEELGQKLRWIAHDIDKNIQFSNDFSNRSLELLKQIVEVWERKGFEQDETFLWAKKISIKAEGLKRHGS
jgi:hypothetical protein